jgi:hypothetical protein
MRLGLAVVAAGVALGGVSAALAGGSDPVDRECNTSVYGALGNDWLPASVVTGPLAFVRAKDYAKSPSRFGTVGGGRYRASKLLVLVQTGWVARVVVPAGQRAKVALQYAPEDFNKAVVPVDSEHDVTFTACPRRRPFIGPASARYTQFNGGIVVAGRRCVTLAVYPTKQGHPLPSAPLRARLSFGVGSCL